MLISDIKTYANSFNLDTLVPISKVQSKQDKQYYTNKQYIVPYTEKEFKDIFPDINIENIYYTNMPIHLNVVYFDKRKMIFFEIPLYPSMDNEAIEDIKKNYTLCIKHREKVYESNNLNYLLFLCPDNVRFNVFYEAFKLNCIPEEHLYKLFISSYTTTDFITCNMDNNDLDYIIKHRSIENKEKTLNKLKDMPDTITIYRGEGTNSRDHSESISWTLDINVANFFAARSMVKGAKILIGKADKKDIIDYITEKNEKEILINPSNVTIVDTIKLKSIVEYKQSIKDILKYYPLYREMIKETIFPYDSQGHGKSHCLRVLFLSLLIANLEDIKDVDLIYSLCLAAAFHDIGRDNDIEDDEHGTKSYEIFQDLFGKNNIVEFLMLYHCKDDAIAKAELNKYNFKDSNKVWNLFKILKDADALDRVRFGIRDLDLNYLRLEVSKSLTLVSVELLSGLEL